MKNIALEISDNGIGIATLDMPGHPFNVFSEQMMADLEVVVDRACGELQGLVIRSGKSSFVAGADLTMIKDFANMRFDADRQTMRDRFSRLGKLFRRIEQCPIPVVAAINGLALGGGLELAMACHGRVCVDSESPLLGLPEVGLGLLPGAGGTQRLPRLIGIEEAVKMLLDGAPVTPASALQSGLVGKLVSDESLVDAAVEMASTLKPGAQWDQPDWQLSPEDQALLDRPDWQQYCIDRGGRSAKRNELYPAVASIIDCVGKGVSQPFDAGCDVEWDIFVDLMSDPVAANMVVSCFLNKAMAKNADEILETVDAAIRSYIAENVAFAGRVALAAKAMDAGLLFARVGVDVLSAKGTPSEQERNKGYAMLAAIALQLLKISPYPHDQLDAAAVLSAGWPQWTGGPIAYLAMLQRGEVEGADFPPELNAAIANLQQPLKTKASYTSAL